MKRFILMVGLLVLVASVGHADDAPAGLQAGDDAPPFALQGSDGKEHRLADLAGKTVVIAWFPKAFTGG